MKRKIKYANSKIKILARQYMETQNVKCLLTKLVILDFLIKARFHL